jgi:hypothetical protein
MTLAPADQSAPSAVLCFSVVQLEGVLSEAGLEIPPAPEGGSLRLSTAGSPQRPSEGGAAGAGGVPGVVSIV